MEHSQSAFESFPLVSFVAPINHVEQAFKVDTTLSPASSLSSNLNKSDVMLSFIHRIAQSRFRRLEASTHDEREKLRIL